MLVSGRLEGFDFRGDCTYAKAPVAKKEPRLRKNTCRDPPEVGPS